MMLFISELAIAFIVLAALLGLTAWRLRPVRRRAAYGRGTCSWIAIHSAAYLAWAASNNAQLPT